MAFCYMGVLCHVMNRMLGLSMYKGIKYTSSIYIYIYIPYCTNLEIPLWDIELIGT